MIYLREFRFPSKQEELLFLHPPDLTPEEVSAGCRKDLTTSLHTGSFYPFNVLPYVGLSMVEFENITIFYGENGCGKTTALNIIAEKLHLKRDTLFNSGRFLNDYLDMCEYNDWDFRGYSQFFNHNSRIITSDDVFNFSMKKREFNKQLFRKTQDVIHEYEELRYGDDNLHPLEDYDKWHARNEARKSKSSFLRKRLEREQEENSNGETAMLYFTDRMENEGLYLLDEPENSLSLENQMALAEFIESSARFFNCQFVIATHSPIFLSLPQAKIYDFDNNSKVVDSWTKLKSMRLMYDIFMKHASEFDNL